MQKRAGDGREASALGLKTGTGSDASAEIPLRSAICVWQRDRPARTGKPEEDPRLRRAAGPRREFVKRCVLFFFSVVLSSRGSRASSQDVVTWWTINQCVKKQRMANLGDFPTSLCSTGAGAVLYLPVSLGGTGLAWGVTVNS